jgi:hypothetical protein
MLCGTQKGPGTFGCATRSTRKPSHCARSGDCRRWVVVAAAPKKSTGVHAGIRRVHPSGLRVPWLGQAAVMGKLIRRSTILTSALTPIAALSLVVPAAGSAQPLDCQNGEWWDPVANVCQPPAAPVPLGCQNGDWWDPVGNVCRPPLVPFPPDCGDGQYFNPVSNACRPLGQV